MNRRQFNLALLTGVAAAAVGGAVWVHLPASDQELSLAAISRELQSLPLANLDSNGAWSISEIFQHLAQSIEYSLTGYPQAKSALFQTVVGTPAFYVFSRKKAMRHPLDEPIPGAPLLQQQIAPELALQRLLTAIEQFQQHQGRLAPHFAYGELSASQYALAHAMHIRQHLTEFSVNGTQIYG